MTCEDVADDPDREGKAGSHKGWMVSDPNRADHVLDAWYLAVWLVTSHQISVPKQSFSIDSSDPWAAQKAQFDDRIAKTEARELGVHAGGGLQDESPQQAFQRMVNRRRGGNTFFGGNGGHYGGDY